MKDCIRIVHGSDSDFYLTVRPSEDEISLYEESKNGFAKIANRSGVSSIQCCDWSNQRPGMVAAGLLNGNTLLLDLGTQNWPAVIPVRQSRPCNAVSFSSNGLLATGLDKVRNDHCLNIYSVNDDFTSSSSFQPVYSLLPSESLFSLAFVPDSPDILLAGSHKFLRIIDLRNPAASLQIPAKSAEDITINKLNTNLFSFRSDSGSFSIWDQRYLSATSPAPLFAMQSKQWPQAATECFRFSPYSAQTFATLDTYTSSSLRLWRSEIVAPSDSALTLSQSLSALHTSDVQLPPQKPLQDKLWLDRCRVIRPDSESIVSFDFGANSHSFVGLRPYGDLVYYAIPPLIDGLQFDSSNSLTSACNDDLSFVDLKGANLTRAMTSLSLTRGPARDANGADSIISDESSVLSANETTSQSFGYNPVTVLSEDIGSRMRARASLGYDLDPVKNLEILRSFAQISSLQYLIDMWDWINLSEKLRRADMLRTDVCDFHLQGVLGIWNGRYATSARPGSKKKRDVLEQNIAKIAGKIEPNMYINSAFRGVLRTSKKSNYRILCLAAAGWSYSDSEFTEKLQKLQDKGEYEVAAALALFHGDISLTIDILAHSGKESLRLISTAVAGYFAYKDSTENSLWKEQCRAMASELVHPYIRAIFAFIADSRWHDVLDEVSLPTRDRLVIALKYLTDDDLDRYLKRLCAQVVKDGSLDGLSVTGITPDGISLLKTYVDHTADVQTAALVSGFCVPHLFQSHLAEQWFGIYREFLDGLKMFPERARFDIGKTKLGKMYGGTPEICSPQIVLRCNGCNKIIDLSSRKDNASGLQRNLDPGRLDNGHQFGSTTCPHCNKPLPRCTICLRSLGSPIVGSSYNASSKKKNTVYDQWFNFCLICGHGMHAGHAQEWFGLHQMCPVPGCLCQCLFNR
ncbi:hypothetical protein CANCADRAFT_89090 [Tortispora caseinolytica NRRL Y-17796]|uniref:Uncharacterized protein n=1 Tax=Tortispora caseinolytica NRRL Y-17796 TaxID=767744 RepID=A0A1E4TLE1_9ASCO|nr:hypothetical protein CANCADRAFT_89090 [Tortispora caseinolytica NRRL Y-17796]